MQERRRAAVRSEAQATLQGFSAHFGGFFLLAHLLRNCGNNDAKRQVTEMRNQEAFPGFKVQTHFVDCRCVDY
jgi:hypothetical protein